MLVSCFDTPLHEVGLLWRSGDEVAVAIMCGVVLCQHPSLRTTGWQVVAEMPGSKVSHLWLLPPPSEFHLCGSCCKHVEVEQVEELKMM